MPTSPKVIIADDHESVRAFLARVLSRTYPVVNIIAVANGAQALAAYHQHGADLLITNYMMPQLHGLDLVRALRAQQVTIPILMISSDPIIGQVGLAAGADRFLLKPFLLAELTQTLIDLLPP